MSYRRPGLAHRVAGQAKPGAPLQRPSTGSRGGSQCGQGELAPADLGTDSLEPYLALGGDQVVVVPNGVYSGGVSAAEHAGWLILVAETPGGVVIEGDLTLRAPTARIMMVGFEHRGALRLEGARRVALWYGKYGDSNASSPGPRGTISIGAAAHGPRARKIWILGADVHSHRADGITVDSSSDVHVQGARVWQDAPGGASHALQVYGGTHDLTIEDTTFGLEGGSGGVRIAARDAAVDGVHFARLWATQSQGFGLEVEPSGAPVRVVREDSYFWGHRSGDKRVSGKATVTDRNSSSSAPPQGLASPAALWREANPYCSYRRWLAAVDEGTHPESRE